jgi:hypothetical protein
MNPAKPRKRERKIKGLQIFSSKSTVWNTEVLIKASEAFSEVFYL